MCTDERIRRSPQLRRSDHVRIEPVDNWHKDWPQVLRAIDAAGHRSALHVDENGWLSARQVLLVAFASASRKIAGHLCFRLAPVADTHGEVMVEAHLDALGVHPGFEKVSLCIESTLRDAAKRRARALKCRRLVGFTS